MPARRTTRDRRASAACFWPSRCLGFEAGRARTVSPILRSAPYYGNPRLQAQVPSVRSTRDVISRLENEVPGLMKQAGVPGMSIALIRGGKTIWLHGFGVKDKKTGEPVRTDTVFE